MSLGSPRTNAQLNKNSTQTASRKIETKKRALDAICIEGSECMSRVRFYQTEPRSVNVYNPVRSQWHLGYSRKNVNGDLPRVSCWDCLPAEFSRWTMILRVFHSRHRR